MKRLVILAGVLLLFAAPAATAKSPPFVGVWKGTVKDANAATQPLVVTIVAKYRSNNSGTVSYPATKCTGKLAFLKQSGRVLTLRETITRGACQKGGALQLTQIDYRTLWVEWWGTGAPAAAYSGYITLGGR